MQIMGTKENIQAEQHYVHSFETSGLIFIYTLPSPQFGDRDLLLCMVCPEIGIFECVKTIWNIHMVYINTIMRSAFSKSGSNVNIHIWPYL
jgi:hypothetical protein